MNSKNIKSVLRKKMDAWFDSIKDERVKSLAQKNSIVTGGSIVSLLLGEDVKDFDVYFKTREAAYAVAEYYVSQFLATHPTESAKVEVDATERVKIVISSAGVASEEVDVSNSFEEVGDAVVEVPNRPAYRPIYLSSNAITLSNKVQLVVRFWGDADSLHKNYDFVHCTNYWESDTGKLTLRPEALEAILTKELRYVGSRYPLCSVIRTRKFISRGWSINAGQYVKMLFQVSKLDLTDIKVLEDQLIGVNSAYFGMLIEALKSKEASEPGFKLDQNYLVALIDKIF